jgi:hypothetical protein
MKKSYTLVALACLHTLIGQASVFADEISVDYQYTQSPQVDFSKATKGPLKLAVFTDARTVEDPRMLTEDLVEVPVADLVNDALKQAFVAGGASLVDQSERLTLEGEITEVAVSEKDGGFEVTIRTHVTLKRGGQSAFNTVIFGRASGQSLDQAVRATLDKLVNSLILDDYFLMEVL